MLSATCARRSLLRCLAGLGLACSSGMLTAVPVALAEDTDAGYVARLYIAHADGSNPRPLIDAPEITSQGSPSWSRDGKQVAFDGWRKSETGSSAAVFVVNVDGSNLRMLTEGAMPSLSPQGRRLAFSRYSLGRGVWIMSSDGPDVELVQIEEAAWGTDWSPDGTRVAFTEYGGEAGMNIGIFNLVEGTRSKVFAPGESPYRQIYWNFAWSPDSRSIAFKGMRKDGKAELAVVDAAGASKGLKVVTDADVLPAVSFFPDGRLLFNQRVPERGNRMQLFAVNLKEETAPQLLTGLAEEFSYLDACPSPDGESILFVRQMPKPSAKPKTQDK